MVPAPIDPTPRPRYLNARRVITHAKAYLARERDLVKVARRLYPTDTVTRSAVVPADASTTGSASDLATTFLSDSLVTTGPPTAGDGVLGSGIVVPFDKNHIVSVPSLESAAANSSWVLPGGSVPHRVLNFDGLALTPHKLVTGFVLTNEVLAASNCEPAVNAVMNASFRACRDGYLFDANPATETRPPGLLNGLTTLGATAAATGVDNLRLDLGKLINAVAAIGGTSIAIVAAPAEAAKILMSFPQIRFPVYATGALASGTVAAIATNALVSGFDPLPRFEASAHAAVFMDTAPTDLVVAGTPASGGDVVSTFQTDSVAIRMVQSVSWGLRAATGAAAFISSCAW